MKGPDGPEDFNKLYGPWLKANSPLKFGQGRSRGEGFQSSDRNRWGGQSGVSNEKAKGGGTTQIGDRNLSTDRENSRIQVKARKNLDKEFELEVGTVLDMDSIPSVAGVSQQRVAVCSVKDTISNNLGQTIIKGPVIRQVEPQGSFSHLPKSYSEEINDLRGQKVILGLGVRT
ncbi:hypothetical protein Q3G72_012152 [Acer saccharum]|nr:hypothetical protein Q3G72_012152 [Acer saccharum]